MSGYHGRNRSPAEGGPQGVQRLYASQLKEHEALFNSYEHLKGLSRGDAALKMLRQVASLVKPVMRKRGWKVQILAEFLPPEANLLGLNINRGHKICIRLRYHNNPDLFLPLEQVVDTMLHELSHNVWGAHDANFHRLWDELRDEWETLTRKGYTGEGFLSEGQKLGGGRQPPPDEMRRRARANAEKRHAQNKLSKGSGQRLGGTPLHLSGGDVRQIIVDQVTRRNTINKGCGSGRSDAVKLSDQAANNTFKTKAEEDDANNRAIAQALYELMEQEEERKLQGTFSEAPTDGGLAWHPEDGLYDPRTERTNGNADTPPSEEEQLKWAMQESLRSTTPDANGKRPPRADHPSRNIERINSAPPAPTHTKPSPVSAVSASGPNKLHNSPISPMTPQVENGQHPIRKRPKNQSSLSSSTIPESDEQSDEQPDEQTSYDRAIGDYQRAISERAKAKARASTADSGIKFPIIDISEPWDPNAAPPDHWTCEVCTCINPLQFLACDACGCERPQKIGVGNRGARPKLTTAVSAPVPVQDASLGWNCAQCGSFMEHKWWTCSACGRMKDSS